MLDTTTIKTLIAEELGIHELPADRQQAVIDTVGNAILTRLVTAAVQDLPDDARTELRAHMDAGDFDATQKLLKEHVPDLKEKAHAAAQRTIEEFKATNTQTA